MSNTKISALTSATTPLAGTEVLPVVQNNTTTQVSVSNLTSGRSVSVNNLTATSTGQTLGSFTRTGYAGYYIGADSGGAIVAPISIDAIQFYNASQVTRQFLLNTSNGNFTLDKGNVVPGTAGNGINFTANTPAAGMTSQLLNWYEEGIWVTVMTADSGTVTLAYNKLNYTRVGRMVSISGEITVNSISSPTGDIYISLPFTAAASSSGRSGVWSSYLGVAYTFNGTPGGPMVGLFSGGATKMTIRVGNNAGGATASGYLTTNTAFDFGFTYQCQ